MKNMFHVWYMWMKNIMKHMFHIRVSVDEAQMKQMFYIRVSLDEAHNETHVSCTGIYNEACFI